jgi:hypothetical protein
MAKKKSVVPPSIKRPVEIKKQPVTTTQPKVTVVTSSHVPRAKAAEPKQADFVFGRLNYILMLSGLLFIIIGFILMSGGGSEDPKVFNPALFDSQRLTFSTLFILLGFVVEIFAILKKPKSPVDQTVSK